KKKKKKITKKKKINIRIAKKHYPVEPTGLKALAFQLLETFNIYKLTSGCDRAYVSECIVVLVV
ncbi:hypothetical protein, partial [Escherichia coli]|uniref:hypothetical protein n=1 Tax=Escherichia coli TaxID=562 RepID=UPI001BB19FA2